MSMKSTCSVFVIILAAAAGAHAQLKFSQSVFPNVITPSNSIACLDNATGLHTDNSYIRFYNPFGEGESAPIITITHIRYGVESATAGTGTTQPIFINVFSAPTGQTSFSAFTLLHQQAIQQTDVSNGGFFTVALTPPVAHTNNANTNLVIELFTPSGVAAGHSFFMGSNALGQTQPCFIAAASCGFPNPANLSNPPFNVLGMGILLDVCYANAALTYPGTSATLGDDLDCVFDVGTTGIYTTVSPANETVLVNAGANVEIGFVSPAGTLAGAGDYFAAGSLVTAGTIIPDVAPGVNIYVGGSVFLFDGLRDVFGFPVQLPGAGSYTNFNVPPGLSGTDLVVQGYVLGIAAVNGVYASSNGLTVQFN